MFDKSIFEKDLKCSVSFSDVTISTNDDAKLALKNDMCHEGDIFISQQQTAGRGRLTKTFYSPKDTGVYFSIVLKPNKNFNLDMITVYASLAVCDAISFVFNKESGIKWVNDIYINGKKCSGILCESVSYDDNIKGVVVGIGVNVYKPNEFPDDIKNVATYIAEKSNDDKRARFIVAIYKYFFEYYNKNDTVSAIQKYKEKSVLIGKRVVVTLPNESFEATCLKIDDNCHLIVKKDDGNVVELRGGDVQISHLSI